MSLRPDSYRERVTAGKRNRRITVQRYVTTQNDLGEEVQAWSDLASCWANVRDVSDRERMQAQEVQADITTRFTVAYGPLTSTIDPKDRIVYDGRVYNIYGCKTLEREGVEITAAARTDQ